MQQLEGKRALVCGSTRGIGLATARRLAADGAAVTLAARNEDSLAAVCSDLVGDGHDYIVADFDEPMVLRQVVQKHMVATGKYEILVNNSGGPPGGPIFEASPEEFSLAFSRHLLCNHLLAQALIPGMRDAGYGRIVNVISTSVRQPIPGLGVSNTIRGAVASWAKTLSFEVAKWGITVNNVLPGFTDTDRLRSLIEKKATASGKTVAEIATDMESSIPAGRFADPDETAQAILFLCSPAAAYINGSNLPVDGGRITAL